MTSIEQELRALGVTVFGKAVVLFNCGEGDTAFELIKMGAQSVEGVDPDEEKIKKARAKTMDYPNVVFNTTSMTKTDIAIEIKDGHPVVQNNLWIPDKDDPVVTNPRFSVILTSYNRPKLVTDAIMSVREQTMKSWELLVCDDNSNAATIEAIVKASGGDPRIHILLKAGGTPTMEERKAQTRYSITINEGLQHVRGEFICFCCDDDHIYPECLEMRTKAFDENPDYHVTCCRLRSVSYDASSLWDTSGPPLPGRTYPKYGEIDPDTGRRVEEATWDHILSPISGRADHNQISIRSVCIKELGGAGGCWPVVNAQADVGDRAFFERLDKLGHKALGIDACLVSKRYHFFSAGRATGETRE